MIDLHTHSTHSDGTLTPTQLVRLAAELGVTALALCDHNTVTGLPELMAAAREYGVEGVPGVEFSTGSLGHGLGISAGMAIVAKKDKKERNCKISRHLIFIKI